MEHRRAATIDPKGKEMTRRNEKPCRMWLPFRVVRPFLMECKNGDDSPPETDDASSQFQFRPRKVVKPPIEKYENIDDERLFEVPDDMARSLEWNYEKLFEINGFKDLTIVLDTYPWNMSKDNDSDEKISREEWCAQMEIGDIISFKQNTVSCFFLVEHSTRSLQ